MRRFVLLLVVGGVLWLAACGSSANPSSVTGVAASCFPSTIQSSQLVQCSSSVAGTGTFSNTVSWTASAGSINSAGTFTAPVVSAPTSVTITATSTQNTKEAGTATVVINPVNLQSLTVDAGPQPQTFTARNRSVHQRNRLRSQQHAPARPSTMYWWIPDPPGCACCRRC